eukprot:TRINITY_DN8614_c0_g1_i4.p1 TRINITY_DN8614_c0_g1~~TRINITY_DN8614_c0_g1_i4.p1  ORF type:complete len:144 (-),score=24.76 TRINITY_DN8614_c0_g1_i4:84-515(-)
MPPSIGALKLSFDGSAKGNPSMAGVGGVIRNHEGSILLSYSGPASFCSINKAKVLALKIGLREAKNLNVTHLSVEGDSFCAIQWAAKKSKPPWYLLDIIEEVLDISKSLDVSFYHINRSANKVADHLAKEGVSRQSLLISLCN